MDGNISLAKFTAFSHHDSLASLPDISAGYCQRSLVDELGMITTQMGRKMDQKS
jgi:hypothetical protein